MKVLFLFLGVDNSYKLRFFIIASLFMILFASVTFHSLNELDAINNGEELGVPLNNELDQNIIEFNSPEVELSLSSQYS